MSTLNMAPDFRNACEGWHFHTQQHLVTTHDVPSTWLLTSLSVCVRMLNALWQIWRGTYSVTKQGKPFFFFFGNCPTHYEIFLICGPHKRCFFLSLSIAYTQARNQHIQYVIFILFECSLCMLKHNFAVTNSKCDSVVILDESQANLSLQNRNLS